MMTALLVAAGLMGAAGVILAAAAAHGTHTGAGLDSAAHMLLFHAAALLGGIALVHQALLSRTAGLGALVGFVVGSALFAGDVAARAWLGHRLFPMAAPTGGTILIASWLAIAICALLSR